MEAVGKITLDADTFRALASSTRLTVLKSLDERRKTLTELSRAVKLAQSTMHHHLILLRTAGLVRVFIGDGHTNRYTLRPNAVDTVASHLRQYLNPTCPPRTSSTAKRQER